MATNKTFTVAGVSFHNGEYKVRFANSVSRSNVLARNGHTNIVLVDLGEELEKVDCVDKLLGIDLGSEEANNAVRVEAREYGFLV
jgi:hypothetical protein